VRRRDRIAAAAILAVIALLVVLWLREGNPRSDAGSSLIGEPTTGSAPRLQGLGEESRATPTPPPKATADVQPSDSSGRGPAIRGRVLDADSGQAVQGAWVFTEPTETHDVPIHEAVVTNAEGAFALDARHPGSHAVRVQAPGYLPQDASISARDEMQEILLYRGGSIQGVVRADSGEPIQGARVWCAPRSNRAAWPNLRTSIPAHGSSPGSEAASSAAGEFLLQGLDPTIKYAIRAAKSGWGDRQWRKRIVAVGDEAEVILSPTATICVTFVDAETELPVTAASTIWSTPKGFAQMPMTAYAKAIDVIPEEESPVHLEVRLIRTNPSIDIHEETFLKLRAFGRGYQDSRESVAFRLTKKVRARVSLDRIEDVVLKPITFNASFPGGREFTGRLVLGVGGGAAQGGVQVEFSEGRSVHPVPLAAGPMRVTTAGAQESGFWWRPAGPAVRGFVDERAVDQEIRIVVEGNPVQLDVRDASGRRVQGLNVEVFRDGISRGTWSIWDGGVRGGTGGGRVPLPTLMLPPGQSKVEVRVPDLGVGAVDLDLPGDGEVVERRVQLLPDAADRDALREAFEKRLRERSGGR